MKYDIVIVGGGAAGLACAVYLARSEKKLKVAVIDAGDRLGKKLAATGNGQGNITNTNLSAERYFGSGKDFVQNIALAPRYRNIETDLFHCILAPDNEGRVYPCGRQASALCDSLITEIKSAGFDIRLGKKVTQINNGFTVVLDGGEKIQSDFVLLCGGGKAQKQFKTDGSAYALAQSLGHKITPLYPSLVQLKTNTEHIKTLKGIRAECSVSVFDGDKLIVKRTGDVIFTDYGVSGNAIFSVSPYVTDRKNAVLSLEFLPNIDLQSIMSDIITKKSLNYPQSELLSGTLHNQLGRAVIRRAGCSDPEVSARTVKDFRLDVCGNLGFDYAQVTKGGIEFSQVADNLESKLVKNLFFAGEILDVDGECGGYNLHWAFASGAAAAMAMLKKL